KNKIILQRLSETKLENRTAYFESAIYFCPNTDERPIYSIGRCQGYIGFEPKGENGFGYDPIFYVGEKSYAQLSPKEKDSISHRGKALSSLLKKLSEKYI
ncbi:MAG: non-canonical purine NTP pyrophosphatase, partial [Oscillospiraceae bacterium]